MSTPQTLHIERHADGFATVVLNRPEKLNTLSMALRRELAQVVAEFEADPAVHVLILTANGRAFSAGLDLDEWGSTPASSAGAWDLDAVAAIGQFSGPVIGAINGMAITGGFELALACDVLLAANTASFADTHVKVGLLPGWGGSVRLQQRLGPHRAKELALTGRFMSAEQAMAWGLVNRVVPAEQLRAEAESLARQMLANPPQGLKDYKRLLNDEAKLPFADAMVLERERAQAANVGVTREDILARLSKLRRQRP